MLTCVREESVAAGDEGDADGREDPGSCRTAGPLHAALDAALRRKHGQQPLWGWENWFLCQSVIRVLLRRNNLSLFVRRGMAFSQVCLTDARSTVKEWPQVSAPLWQVWKRGFSLLYHLTSPYVDIIFIITNNYWYFNGSRCLLRDNFKRAKNTKTSQIEFFISHWIVLLSN